MASKSSDDLESTSKGYLTREDGYDTSVVHSGLEDKSLLSHDATVPNISLSTNFMMNGFAEHNRFVYGRYGNPSRQILENSIASLEHGTYGLAFCSGIAAVQAVTMLLDSGDHLVVGEDLYGGSTLLWKKHTSRAGIKFSFVDTRDIQAVEAAITEDTKMIFVETPTNPTMKITDLRVISALAKRSGNIITVCDNTFMTPYFQRPLDFGIDISLNSATKYLNGHCDVTMGVLVTNSEILHGKLASIQAVAGIVPSPFDCYLVYRGIRTLHVRMRQHMKSALVVAKFLQQHQHVQQVLYPGLESHPQHELFKSQAYGCSGMISFYIAGEQYNIKKFFNKLNLCSIAGSLGGYKTLIVGPVFSTHSFADPEELSALNITENMIRISVGLEDARDICHDLDQALKAAFC